MRACQPMICCTKLQCSKGKHHAPGGRGLRTGPGHSWRPDAAAAERRSRQGEPRYLRQLHPAQARGLQAHPGRALLQPCLRQMPQHLHALWTMDKSSAHLHRSGPPFISARSDHGRMYCKLYTNKKRIIARRIVRITQQVGLLAAGSSSAYSFRVIAQHVMQRANQTTLLFSHNTKEMDRDLH
jgi:hypothetical protein